ncbi:2-keto-4-pentenoate hydratase [Endozoicomonas montiporae]|uniref:2-keto-4-pentenoate hydratase n=2 Tax=Endozoicomonas montiporae TaxID=1027273 RepID=A0A081N6Q9_9GAMM|nr:fumarylacetoacetate hydrolase family protein [Endozoicomonas montiporae]AMO56466.1 fumarylacetoacetate (FAA) hydrolase [Endozoicomonas montiporae CL-33]KEQ14132.1 2-keto-4-pentenoate hydratase [Endozoicomonas montiporae]
MKLASYQSGRDGQLHMVSSDLKLAIPVPDIASTLRDCLDNWDNLLPQLVRCQQDLNAGNLESKATPFNPARCSAPLPRATQWLDGSAYVNHVELARKARGAAMPERFWTDPLMYQGVSDNLLGPCDNIVANSAWGVDFEAELAVITDDVPMGCSAEEAHKHILLVTLCNDISLRNLIPDELEKGFGFVQSKPPSTFGPVAVTPDELGTYWQDGKLSLPMQVHFNNQPFGHPDCARDMTFNFNQLIAHAAKTRPLGRGTIIGSGTVSNKDKSTGSCCLVEQRMLEIIAGGQTLTPYLKAGDTVRIEVTTPEGQSLFGAIEQTYTGNS